MMRIAAILTGLALCSCAGAGPSLGKLDVRPSKSFMAEEGDAYALAKRQLALGNFALAIDGFRKAIRQNPQSADAYNGLAVAYDRIGRHDLSREGYEQALALSPNDSAILSNLARSLAAAGKKAEGVAVFAAKPAAPNPGARLERVSSREVALVTGSSGSGWAAIGSDATPRRAVPVAPVFAQSRQGVLEIALEAPAAVPSASRAVVPVVILNAVGRRGLARRMSDFLEDKGWSKASVGDARLRPRESLMFHAPKDRLAAVQLSRSLPFSSRLVVAPRARQVILFVGRNAVAFDEQLRSIKNS